jgi:protein involved in polysaccharide export with SLBB domain
MRHALLLSLLCLAAGAEAQPSFGVIEDRQTNVPSYYFHVLPGEATIGVYVWGTVRAPGLYEVGADTGLGELLSLAGGPAVQPERDDQVVVTTVRLFRFEGDERVLTFEEEVEGLVRQGDFPPLRDGDIVEAETTVTQLRPFTWRDALSIVTGAAALALAVERVASAL